MDPSWFKVIAAALGSGLFLKLLDISHSELRRKKEHSETVKEFVDDHLDPILKSADELVGKLRNLAMEDFSSLKKIQMENEKYFISSTASLSGLAKAVHETPHHVSQVINEKMGQSFFELLATYRVKEAKAILKTDLGKKLTIEEVAERVGYNSKSAFNTAFKKITSETPSSYRDS